jgi:hypothetical protein
MIQRNNSTVRSESSRNAAVVTNRPTAGESM